MEKNYSRLVRAHEGDEKMARSNMTQTTIPHARCKTPSECRKEQICFDTWHCSSQLKPMVQPTDEQRRSRLELYRAHEQMGRAIVGMPVSEAVRSELKVLFAAAFRMALLHNDGHLSPRELMTW